MSHWLEIGLGGNIYTTEMGKRFVPRHWLVERLPACHQKGPLCSLQAFQSSDHRTRCEGGGGRNAQKWGENTTGTLGFAAGSSLVGAGRGFRPELRHVWSGQQGEQVGAGRPRTILDEAPAPAQPPAKCSLFSLWRFHCPLGADCTRGIFF